MKKIIFLSFIIGCGIPNTDSLDKIEVEEEGLYALPLASIDYSELGIFLTPKPFTYEFKEALIAKGYPTSGGTATRDFNVIISTVEEEIDLGNSFESVGQNASIKEIVFSKGSLSLSFKTNLSLEIFVSIKNLTKNRRSDVYTEILEDKDKTITIPLEGHKILLNQNKINVKLWGNIKIKKGDALPRSFNLKPVYSMKETAFNIVKGKFGSILINDIKPVPVDLSNLVGKQKNFRFGKTGYVFAIDIKNPFGVPIEADVSGTKFVDENDGIFYLTKKNGDSKIKVKQATLQEDGTVKNSNDSLQFTSSNSNIDELFAKSLKRIVLDVVMKVNSNDEGDFIKSGTAVSVSSRAQLPLVLKL